jgi:hypothetical protein
MKQTSLLQFVSLGLKEPDSSHSQIDAELHSHSTQGYKVVDDDDQAKHAPQGDSERGGSGLEKEDPKCDEKKPQKRSISLLFERPHH